MNTRNRTSSEYIGYGLYFYFSGISLRKTSERLSSCFIKREKSCINQSGIGYKQKYKPKKIFERKKKIKEFIIDESLIKSGSELIDMALDC
jgi:putative transposase